MPPLHILFALCMARLSLNVGRTSMNLARAVVGRGVDPNWARLDRVTLSFLMMWLYVRILVARAALCVAEWASDFAAAMIGEKPDDRSGDHR